MISDLLSAIGIVIGGIFAWWLCGIIIATIALAIKAAFKPNGQRWQFIKEICVISPDAWFSEMAKLGPSSIFCVPFLLLGRHDPQNERDQIDLKLFRQQTGLTVEQWVTHGHRDANTERCYGSLEQFDENLGKLRDTIEAMPAQVTYWAKVSAYWTKRYAWVTATCAVIITTMRTGVALAADTLKTMATETGTIAQTQSKPKPKFSLNGLVITSADITPHIDQAPTGSVTLTKLRFDIQYRHGQWNLRAIVDPNMTLQVRVAEIGYDMDPRLMFKMGRFLAIPTRLNPSPAKAQYVVSPLSHLKLSGTDNGIEAYGQLGSFNYRTAVMNGSGKYKDDNEELDFAAQISCSPSDWLQLQLTGQTGKQPTGDRTLKAADVNINLGPIFWRGLILERPDLQEKGFLTEINVRAGPNTFVLFADQISGDDVVRRLDIGVNRQLSDKCLLRCHSIFSSNGSPQYVMRLQHSF
jgi:hypothetical protein